MKLFSLLCLGWFSSLVSAQNVESTSVLFIGNSFTFYNEMPVIFKEIAASFDRTVEIDTVVEGGMNLAYHSQQPFTYQKIKEKKWDYVVIQGHSNEFAKYDPEIIQNTLPYLERILDSVQANYLCSKVLLYMTWGYQDGNKEWDAIKTYESMQDLIERQYLRTADFLSLGISPVGAVWREVRKKHKRMNLYDPDKFHPSLNGSYISACTFYSSIFGVSPVGASVSCKINAKEKQEIEMLAADVVLKDRPKWRQSDRRPPLQVGYDLIQKGDSIQLVNNALQYDYIDWFLGDGTHSTEQNIIHHYTAPGEYEITQRVSNECGIKELTRIITVE